MEHEQLRLLPREELQKMVFDIRDETARLRAELHEHLLCEGNTDGDGYVNTFQACNYLGISESTLKRLRKSYKVKWTKNGNRCLYRFSDIRNFHETSKQ